MKDFKVWRLIPAYKKGKGKVVKVKWVHDLKADGVVRARLVAMEFAWDLRQDTFAGTPGLVVVRFLISKVATVAAFGYRHSRGLPYIYPDCELSYCGNLLNMLFNEPGKKYVPDPILERALNILFILHADHEQNCSASTMRGIGSSQADP